MIVISFLAPLLLSNCACSDAESEAAPPPLQLNWQIGFAIQDPASIISSVSMVDRFVFVIQKDGRISSVSLSGVKPISKSLEIMPAELKRTAFVFGEEAKMTRVGSKLIVGHGRTIQPIEVQRDGRLVPASKLDLGSTLSGLCANSTTVFAATERGVIALRQETAGQFRRVWETLVPFSIRQCAANDDTVVFRGASRIQGFSLNGGKIILKGDIEVAAEHALPVGKESIAILSQVDRQFGETWQNGMLVRRHGKAKVSECQFRGGKLRN